MKNLKNRLTASVISFLVIGGSCLPNVFAVPPKRRCKFSLTNAKETDQAQSKTVEYPEATAPLENESELSGENLRNLPSVDSAFVKVTKFINEPSKARDKKPAKNDPLPLRRVASKTVANISSENPNAFSQLPSLSVTPAMSGLSETHGYPAEYLDKLSWSHISIKEVEYALRDLDDFRAYLRLFEGMLAKQCMYSSKNSFDTLLDRFARIKHHIQYVKDNDPASSEFFNQIKQSVEKLDNLDFRSEIVSARVKKYVERQYLKNEQFLNQTRANCSSLQDYAMTLCRIMPDFMQCIVYDVRDKSFQKDNLTPNEVLNLVDRLIKTFFRTMIYRLYTGEIQ